MHGNVDLGQKIEMLSPRERECLLWCALGLRSKQIAQTLGIADSTVNEYFSAAIKKLGARSRAHAVAILVQWGSSETQDSGN